MSWNKIDELQRSLVCRSGIFSHRLTLTTSVTRLGTVAGRNRLFLTHSSTLTVWVGGTNVSTANGFPIPSGQVTPLPVTGDIVVYGIASGSVEVSILEMT